LADPVGSLPDGGLASVSIVTGDTRGVTAVPTSAVTTSTTGHTVVVVDGGKTSTVDVQVGTVGSRWTEVTGGLEVGQVVVLADLSEALPGTATSGSTASSTGAAGAGTRTGAFRSAQSSSGRGS
jgi:HlyD family secretion protein